MEPDMRTFTITMPAVGVFLFGTALCCFCCFKYGLQRWYERTLEKTRTKSRTGITYAASLQYKKEQVEHALRKVMKLRKAEPTRSDLKYEEVALKEGIRMLHEHLRNSERYTDYCEAQKRPRTAGSLQRLSMDVAHGSSFVNPMFTAHQPISTGKASDAASVTSSDEECHNPKHRELELYLMSTGGAILPSLLAYPSGSSPPPRLAGASRRASPLGRRELATDGDRRSLSASPAPDSPPPPPPPPPGMPPNWQQMSPIINRSFGSNPRLEV